MCWFVLVSNIWGCLATLYYPITASENIANNPYICLGLFYNLSDRWTLVYSKSIILGIWGPVFVPLILLLSLARRNITGRVWCLLSKTNVLFKF